jgi:hypothetical protein
MRIRTALAILVLSSTASAADVATASSPENLVKQVLAGLETKDEQALKRLVVSQTEFRKYVWPTLAASVGNVTAEKYFVTYMQTNDVGLADRLKSLGGQKWELVKVSLGPERKGKGYRIIRGTEAVLRNAAGEEKTFPIAGAVLDEGGAYKVATYYLRDTSAK